MDRALKIIMHSNYIYTSTHPQRHHDDLNLGSSSDEDSSDDDAPYEDDDRGYSIDDFTAGDPVSVWYLSTWWPATVVYKRRKEGTITVRIRFSDESISGMLPKHIKPRDV